MANPKLGTKRGCPSCGARFYDLGKNPAECPECETVFNPEDQIRGRRAKTGVADDPVDKKKDPTTDGEAVDDLDKIDAVDGDDDDAADDDTLMEDTSDLGDDDVAAVIDAPERPDSDG